MKNQLKKIIHWCTDNTNFAKPSVISTGCTGKI